MNYNVIMNLLKTQESYKTSIIGDCFLFEGWRNASQTAAQIALMRCIRSTPTPSAQSVCVFPTRTIQIKNSQQRLLIHFERLDFRHIKWRKALWSAKLFSSLPRVPWKALLCLLPWWNLLCFPCLAEVKPKVARSKNRNTLKLDIFKIESEAGHILQFLRLEKLCSFSRPVEWSQQPLKVKEPCCKP